MTCNKCKNREEHEARLRNKIFAVEKQAKCFRDRLQAFKTASRWQRLVMAWKGEV